MRDTINDIMPIIWGIWRFRWTAIAAAWRFALFGWIMVDLMSVQYRATAKVYLDSNRVLGPLLRNMAVQPDNSQRIGLLSKTLLNRPNLERLVDTIGLDKDITERADKEIIMEMLAKKIVLSGDRRNNELFNISYSHPDRDKALTGVNTLLEIFTETTVGEKRQDNQKAQNFLDAQIADYEERLLVSEKKLSDFKRENAANLPDENGGFYDRFSRAEDQLRRATIAQQEAINRRDVIRIQLANEPQIAFPQGSRSHPLDGRIDVVTNQLQSLRLRFTDQHPEIAQLQLDLQSLQRQKAQTPFETVGGANAGVTSLAYQEIKSLLAQAEASVAETRTRVNAYTEQLEGLKDTRYTLPEMEAQLLQLNRDYVIVKEQYDQLLGKRESARLSGELDENVEEVPFRIIDPVYAPLRPSEPRKKILNLLVLFMAGLVGAGIAFVVHFFKPMFFDQKMLAQVTKLPVLGTVTLQRRDMENKWFTPETKKYFALAFCLPLAFLVISLAQSKTPKKSISSFIAGNSQSEVSVASGSQKEPTDALQQTDTIVAPTADKSLEESA